MLTTSSRRVAYAAFWLVASLLTYARAAHAVIPGLQAPLQQLGQILPQILPFIGMALAAIFSVRAWRERMYKLGRWVKTPVGIGILSVVVCLVAVEVVFHKRNHSVTYGLAAGAAPATQGADWAMFRANLTRTGASASGAGPLSGDVLWSFKDSQASGSDISSSPSVVGNRVYVGSAQVSVFDTTGMVYCVDANTGKPVWQFQTEKQVFSSPAVVGNRVYVGEGLHTDSNCKVYCLDAATGKKIWEITTKSHTESSPSVVGGKVYLGAGDDGAYCLDAATGKTLWHQGGMHIDVSPAVSGDKVFLSTGYGKFRALALDANTGKIVWDTPCDLPVWGDPAIVGGKVYYGYGNGNFVKSDDHPAGGLWCLDSATGKSVWKQKLPDAVVTSILALNGKIYAGCRDSNVYAADAATGNIVWKANCGGPVVASPATDGTHLYVAGGKGQIVSLNLANGQTAWKMELGPQTAPDMNVYSSPALSNGRLFVGTTKEKLFCIGK